MKNESIADKLDQQSTILSSIATAVQQSAYEQSKVRLDAAKGPVQPSRITHYVRTPDTDATIQLGWLAQTLTIDNYTSQWWYLPSEVFYIPPYTVGLRLNFNTAQQTAYVQVAAPTGRTQYPEVDHQLLRLTFDSRQLVPSPGLSVFPSEVTMLHFSGVTTQETLVSTPVLYYGYSIHNGSPTNAYSVKLYNGLVSTSTVFAFTTVGSGGLSSTIGPNGHPLVLDKGLSIAAVGTDTTTGVDGVVYVGHL